jgi:hypothetical protein
MHLLKSELRHVLKKANLKIAWLPQERNDGRRSQTGRRYNLIAPLAWNATQKANTIELEYFLQKKKEESMQEEVAGADENQSPNHQLEPATIHTLSEIMGHRSKFQIAKKPHPSC